MPQRPMAEAGLVCPLHRRDMSEVCHKCPWWTYVRMKCANTGHDVDEYGCAITNLLRVTFDVGAASVGTTAAVQDLRNRMFDPDPARATIVVQDQLGHSAHAVPASTKVIEHAKPERTRRRKPAAKPKPKQRRKRK